MKRVFAVVLTVLAGLGCQQKPTRIRETANLPFSLLMRNAMGPLEFDEKTVVIDARPAFEYGLSHVPGAINLQWQDFTNPSAPFPGKVKDDLQALARRLALLGISPQSRVVVMGLGLNGMGEEGRVAWSLLQMGVGDVQVVSVDRFRRGIRDVEPPPRPNVPTWSPVPRPELEANRDEVLAIATARLKEGERVTRHIVDVRSRDEYFRKKGLGESYDAPDLGALHIPWQEFYTAEGRPNPETRSKLLALGWRLDDRIVIISDKGVRSGAAAFSLMSFGFQNVGNYTGGYPELLTEPKEKPIRARVGPQKRKPPMAPPAQAPTTGPKERPPGK